MIAFPNAKINIGLHVTGKRPDGYHNIESCFYPAPWSDVLEIVASDSFKFAVTGLPIPGDASENLCIRAYNMLKSEFGIGPVRMHLHKIIPTGAGLGGGSSDGAFALKIINELFDLKLSVPELEAKALELGSDCPFFIKNKPVFVSGRGEKFLPLRNFLEGKYICLVNPGIPIPTGEAYRGINAYSKENSLRPVIENEPAEAWKEKIRNDFETFVFKKHPEIARIKETLYAKGAIYSAMTGSGSTVYGLFDFYPELHSKFPDTYILRCGKIE